MSTSRKITVYNTKGGQPKSFESSAEKWGDLRTEIQGQGYEVDKLLATESVTRRDLNNLEATLPAEDFIVFLRPKKTKSGMTYGYKDAKNHIKNLIEKYGEDAKAHFCDFEGKNYSQMSTSMLNEAINAYTPPTNEASSSSPVCEEEGQQMTQSNDIADDELTIVEKIQKATDLIGEVVEETMGENQDVCDHAIDVFEQLEGLLADAKESEDLDDEESEEDRIAREEQEEADRLAQEEQERLDAEASDLMGGFRD